MGITYSNNFDGEVEGTSPPAGFTNIDLANLEVDDTQFASAPHSCWIKGEVAGGWLSGYFSESYNGAEKISFKARMKDLLKYYRVDFTDTDAVPGAGNWITFFYFDSSNNIKMMDGTVTTDTGFNYVAGAFKLCEIQFNFGADTYDAWYDGNLIADDWDFYQSGNSLERFTMFAHNNPSEWWIDDIQFGETAGWVGMYLGVDNPAKINGVSKENVNKVMGVLSA